MGRVTLKLVSGEIFPQTNFSPIGYAFLYLQPDFFVDLFHILQVDDWRQRRSQQNGARVVFDNVGEMKVVQTVSRHAAVPSICNITEPA